PNGAGKTTLLGCLLGFLRPDAGRIAIGGRAPDDLAVRAATGYLPERLSLDRWMTGLDYLRYQHALARLPAATRSADAAQALAQVGLEPAAGRRRIRRYSRGMLQRLGLAQALLGRPRYLFLDEPVSGVDPEGVLLFRRLLSELKGSGVTVVLNSHQLEQVERVCDRVAFVRQGQVDSIETLAAGAELSRVLRVRVAAGAPLPGEALAAAARDAGAELVSAGAAQASFQVPGDAAAARLLRALIAAGIPVVEATAEQGRLERLFMEAAGGRGAAAPTRAPGAPPDRPAGSPGEPGGAP
ncbi:MAG TPA: ABC transporter ATP-binding protein, partial [Candidatus Saccharimonadales bacterium]|nr:ABC transporter ATP-binding protein [Candidatus Saccharimonadales bacterium]